MIFNDILMIFNDIYIYIYIYIYIQFFNSWKKVDIKLNDLMSSAHTHVVLLMYFDQNTKK